MKKIVLFLVIFLNLFTYVESSPIISPAGIIIATRNYKDKKAEEEKINEKFNILYKNEKDYDYLKYFLSNSEKEILVENYSNKEELWNKFLEKYKVKIENMKEEIKFLENATEKEKIMFVLFKYRYILLASIFIIVFVSVLNFLLKREIRKLKEEKINDTKTDRGVSMVFSEKGHDKNE